MLLGIFLYNGTMFYELKNGTLVETKDAQGNFDLTQVLGNKYLEDVDSEKCVIVDTYSNRCFLISKDLLHHGVSEEVYHKMLDSDETDSNKSSEEVTFILTITYKCNMHCTYCYQQNDKTLEKETDALYQDIMDKKTEVREPVYEQEAQSRNTNDIGYSYIEIDLTRQRMVLYQNGSPIVDTGFAASSSTPTGVYRLGDK